MNSILRIYVPSTLNMVVQHIEVLTIITINVFYFSHYILVVAYMYENRCTRLNVLNVSVTPPICVLNC